MPKVLLIEDEASIRAVLKDILKDQKKDFESLLTLLDYHKNNNQKKNLEFESQKLKTEARSIEEKLAEILILFNISYFFLIHN